LDYLCVLKQENYIAIYLLAERKQLASILSDALKREHYFHFEKHCSYLLTLFGSLQMLDFSFD